MNYRNVVDLNNEVLHLTRRLPRDLELVVGIPRSGLLAANLLALHLNLPLTDIESFAAGRIFSGGDRGPAVQPDRFLDRSRKALVVDDSVLYGTQMACARGKLRHLESRHRILYAAIYVQPGQEGLVDFHGELLPRPRVFEWHLMHHGNLRHWCVDIDGVLCDDPTPAENDDGEGYRRFLRDTVPKTLPSKEIGWLVTCRIEKYRRETEEWLTRHGIRYRHLVMMDYPDAESRKKASRYAAFKADVYKQTDSPLFIESSSQQAVEIAFLSGKSVFCFETREMVRPGLFPQLLHQPRSYVQEHLRLPRIEILRTVKDLLKF